MGNIGGAYIWQASETDLVEEEVHIKGFYFAQKYLSKGESYNIFKFNFTFFEGILALYSLALDMSYMDIFLFNICDKKTILTD